jgi:prepilin-type processing-associated H-X9-DG protein
MKRFTLIELAIVIAALLLIYIILVPRLGKAEPHAYMTNCIGNMKQLGYAGVLYSSDNKEARPGPQPMGVGIPEISWDRSLAIQAGANLGSLGKDGVYEPVLSLTTQHTAVKILMTFACSVDTQIQGARSIPVTPGSLVDGTAAGTGICRSYTLNLGSGNLVKDVDDGISPNADAVPSEKIQSDAGTVYLIENHGYATVFGQRNIANDTYLTCDRTGNVIPKDAFVVTMMPKHGKKAKPQVNTLMYDGHVEQLDEAFFTADKGKIMQYIK